MPWPTPADVRVALRIDASAGVPDEVLQAAIDASVSYTARRCGIDSDWSDENVFPVTPQRYEAVLLMTLRRHRRKDSPLGVVDTFDLGPVYPTKVDPDYEALLVGERVAWGLA